MQIEFLKNEIRCLQEQAVDVIYQEETAEFIVPDVYPDAAKVVEVSAICCQREQEMHSGSMTVSGTFHATVLFLAEESEEVCVQDVFLPYSVRLSADEIPDNAFGQAEVRIRSADARIINSRKLMVRVSYAARLSVYTPSMLCIRSYEGNGKVQVLQTDELQYVAIAAAEKTMTFSESIQLPEQNAPLRRVIRVRPSLHQREQRLTEGRAVWQGSLELSILCLLDNGQVSRSAVELPVAQYLDLDIDSDEGMLRILPVLTDFRLEEDASGTYLLSAGIRFQAMVWGSIPVTMILDGYCIGAEFKPEFEPAVLRSWIAEPKENVMAESAMREMPHKPVDCAVWVDFPVCRRGEKEISVGTVVNAQALCYDENGTLFGETARTEVSCSFPAGKDTVCYADADATGHAVFRPSEKKIQSSVDISVRCVEEKKLQTIIAAQTEQKEGKQEDLPSLIVRRISGETTLWDVAKKAGTTVQAIQDANSLDGDTLQNGMLLLIPAAME